MDVLNDVWTGDGKDVAVIEQILLVGQEAGAARVSLFQPVTANGRPHGPIDDQNSLAHGGFEFRADIRACRHGGN